MVDNQDTTGIRRVTNLLSTTNTTALTHLILQQLMEQIQLLI